MCHLATMASDDEQALAAMLRDGEARGAAVAAAYRGLDERLQQSAAAFRANTDAELQRLQEQTTAAQQEQEQLIAARAEFAALKQRAVREGKAMKDALLAAAREEAAATAAAQQQEVAAHEQRMAHYHHGCDCDLRHNT